MGSCTILGQLLGLDLHREPSRLRAAALSCKPAERCWRLARVLALQHCQHVMVGMCAGAMAPLGSSELPGQVVALVRGKLRAAPVLRTKWALLARDLLALLTGLRTGVMLDYAAMQPAVLLELVDGVAQLAVMGALRAAYISHRVKPPLQRRPCHSSEVMGGSPCRVLLIATLRRITNMLADKVTAPAMLPSTVCRLV